MGMFGGFFNPVTTTNALPQGILQSVQQGLGGYQGLDQRQQQGQGQIIDWERLRQQQEMQDEYRRIVAQQQMQHRMMSPPKPRPTFVWGEDYD